MGMAPRIPALPEADPVFVPPVAEVEPAPFLRSFNPRHEQLERLLELEEGLVFGLKNAPTRSRLTTIARYDWMPL